MSHVTYNPLSCKLSRMAKVSSDLLSLRHIQENTLRRPVYELILVLSKEEQEGVKEKK